MSRFRGDVLDITSAVEFRIFNFNGKFEGLTRQCYGLLRMAGLSRCLMNLFILSSTRRKSTRDKVK